MKNKILYIFALILFAIVLSNTNVNAAEYKDKDDGIIITMNDLGLGGTTKSVKANWRENDSKSEDYDYDFIYNNVTIENVKQTTLNEYAKSPRNVKANIKLKLPNDTSKVVFYKRNYSETESKEIETDINKEYKIETINGNKYLTYSCDLRYDNISGEEPVDSNIRAITLHSNEIIYMDDLFVRIYKTNENYQKYSINTEINIVSENKPFNWNYEYENKYGQKYPQGGAGGAVEDDKSYLTSKGDVEGYYGFSDNYWLPTGIKLSETYGTLYIDVYQGNKIEVEGMGTLNYAGVSKRDLYGYEGIYYVYKNSLNNLKKITEAVIFKAKTENGYVLTRGIADGWTFAESSEELIKVENTDITLNMLRYDEEEVGATTAKKTDTIYAKLKNGYNDIKEEYYKGLNISIEDLCIVSGAYQGNINLTFDVGTQYNGKKYIVFYNRDWIDSNYYAGTVKDGKVTITIHTSEIKRANDNIIKPGDINGDGKINTKDAREALLAYIGKNKLTDVQRAVADVNKDGKVNTKDARQILLYYIGKIKQF